MGQYRSGTSLLAGCFQELGASLGRNVIIEPDEFNTKGYYENKDIFKFNEELLRHLNSSLYDPNELPKYWHLYCFSFFRRLRKIFQNDLNLIVNNNLIVYKDPRISVLLPLYIRVLSSLKVNHGFIFSQRPDIEIQRSLRRAQNLNFDHSLMLINKIKKSVVNCLGDSKKLIWLSTLNCLSYKPVKVFEYIKNKFEIPLEIDEKKIVDFINLNLRHFKSKTNCEVISTYAGNRRHSDSLGAFQVLKEHINNILVLTKGLDSDTIVVNHNIIPYLRNRDIAYEWELYLKQIDGIPTRNGVLKVINRDWNNGIGGSFYSFDHAVDIFQNNYNYWFFREDNYVIYKNNIYKLAIDQLNKNDKIAFVCCYRAIGIKCVEGLPKHADGGCGVTHISYINEVLNKYNHLPYSSLPMEKSIQNRLFNFEKVESKESRKWYRNFELEGEVKFTNCYTELGYDIEQLKYNGSFIYWKHIRNNETVILEYT